MADGKTKLETWQERLEKANAGWKSKVSRMDIREKIYNGRKTIDEIVPGDDVKETPHVRNIVKENIESQVSSIWPMPKVTARHPRHEHLAAIIEHWLRNEMTREHFESLNDQAERTVPIQGGVVWHEEWDETLGGHNESGRLVTSLIHPKDLAPQPGVTTGIEDMDWVILKIPTTKEKLKRRYDVDLTEESEAEPELRGSGSQEESEDTVTQYIGYQRNENGGIDKYVWVNDTELEDLENYQARRLDVCAKCGLPRPNKGQIISHAVEIDLGDPQAEAAAVGEVAGARALAGQLAGQDPNQQQSEGAQLLQQGAAMLKNAKEPPEVYDGGPCPFCGANEWITQEQGYEAVYIPIKTELGHEIPGEHPALDPETNAPAIDPETGLTAMEPTLIPYYRPNVYPVVLQKNVSVFGQLLGGSDVDTIETQQNTTNRLEAKILKRLLAAGTRVTLPDEGNLRIDPKDNTKWYIKKPADKNLIGVYEFKGDLHYELAQLANVYEEARQLLGITDSFQGRKDSTATSAKAKEFSANMSAGRLQSKRTMKNEAYSRLFELKFKFFLAYADEPRYVMHHDEKGELLYEEFNRYDFIEQDPITKEWYWNDEFIFSVDSSAPLSNNQEAMWQETRMNFSEGTFGNPQDPETQILFWTKMALLHYPGAEATKKALEDKLQKAQAAQMGAMPGAPGTPGDPTAGDPSPSAPMGGGMIPPPGPAAPAAPPAPGVPPELTGLI